eukprot:SAG31_NODE_11683_length_1007_cov_0.939427_1_plen_148_part_10
MCVGLVCGYLEQRRISILGRPLSATLVARRSKEYAGTRYLKRGINNAGYAANDVETEQILQLEPGACAAVPVGSGWRFSSFVHVRGSIPLFWKQTAVEPSSGSADRLYDPRPVIIPLEQLDPGYRATEMHFNDLGQRYGWPVVCLNLV